MEEVLWRCCRLSSCALEQRNAWWRRGGPGITRFQQEAELRELRAAFVEYATLHSQVVQDVLARLGRTYRTVIDEPLSDRGSIICTLIDRR